MAEGIEVFESTFRHRIQASEQEILSRNPDKKFKIQEVSHE